MNRNFWIIALISFINSLSFTIIIPVLYLYGRQFKLDDFQTSFIFAIYSIAQFFSTPIIGKLSDRFGRKPLAPRPIPRCNIHYRPARFRAFRVSKLFAANDFLERFNWKFGCFTGKWMDKIIFTFDNCKRFLCIGHTEEILNEINALFITTIK